MYPAGILAGVVSELLGVIGGKFDAGFLPCLCVFEAVIVQSHNESFLSCRENLRCLKCIRRNDLRKAYLTGYCSILRSMGTNLRSPFR